MSDDDDNTTEGDDTIYHVQHGGVGMNLDNKYKDEYPCRISIIYQHTHVLIYHYRSCWLVKMMLDLVSSYEMHKY